MAEFKPKGKGFCRECGKEMLINRTGYCETCWNSPILHMRDINEIVSIIKNNENEIIANLNYKSLKQYKDLQNEFIRSSDITNDYQFQSFYRSFYIMDSAGLTNEMKQEYFKIMQEKRDHEVIDPSDVAKRLYQFKRIKGDNSLQFSFTTKLMHTVNNAYPIYDSEASRVFNFTRPDEKDYEKRLKNYVMQYNEISKTYKAILSNNLLDSTLKLFDETFKNNNLPNVKKIDFVFWSGGKILKNK